MHQTQTGLQLEQNSMQIPGNDTGTPNNIMNIITVCRNEQKSCIAYVLRVVRTTDFAIG